MQRGKGTGAGGQAGNRTLITAGVLLVLVALAILATLAYAFRDELGSARSDLGAAVLPAALAALANEDRKEAGLKPLAYDERLAEAARLKAQDMATRGYFAHRGPDGEQPWEWLDEVGYTYTYAGENLAVRFTESKDVQRAWMASPTHRDNIVRPEFTHVGLGTARGVYKGKETTFVVQFLARPRATSSAPVPAATRKASLPDMVTLLASAALALGSGKAGELTPQAATVAIP